MSLPTRRALVFDTPQRTPKRARMTPAKRKMQIPKSLLPEMKQYTKPGLTSTGTNFAESSVLTDLSQADNSNAFIGAKFRAKRLRFNYSFENVTGLSRVIIYIPKNPSAAFGAVITGPTEIVDTQLYTVLYERFVPADASTISGTLDVPMNIHCELDKFGLTPQRNDIRVFVFNSGGGVARSGQCSYGLWFTDN